MSAVPPTPRRIRTLLVANRGEIACRIFRTARSMGIETVAVHSDADADALFVREADRAVRLPGVAPADTYLRADLIVEAALRSGADAIHPGYGFLSENADFARSVAAAGLIFVGPSPETIAAMGSKIRAKQLMHEAGVPILPGATVEAGQSDAELRAAADRIGYPVLVKASAGGGGRGMRIVAEEQELVAAVASARREAGSAFGDDTVFLEKYVTAPRHIEVQIFGDRAGKDKAGKDRAAKVVSLFERECSIQRRHQKIIEEAPSPAVTPELRRRLGEAAELAGAALGYEGAGTVEFVMDSSGAFFFLEVNTRIQVEHPVTEAITGLDLVRLQLLVAQGEPLPAAVSAPTITGHAIEARLYAEDPAAGFLPTSGRLRDFTLDDRARVDAGFAAGDVVSIHYDSMLAKVIVHAPTRTEAALALALALERSRIHGVGTNRDLLVGILREPEFLAGGTDTAYLERHPATELQGAPGHDPGALAAAALALRARHREDATVQRSITPGFRNVPSQPAVLELRDGDGTTHVVTYRIGDADTEITVDGSALGGRLGFTVSGGPAGWEVVLEADGLREQFHVAVHDERIDVDGRTGGAEFERVDPLPEPTELQAVGSLAAPMPGSVVRLEVSEGDEIRAGDPVLVLEAMKMEHQVRAPSDGRVTSVLVAVGEQVDLGQVLAVVGTEDAP